MAAALPDSLADALRDRYSLEREIGHGGMAVVFLALDVKHRRKVAVKVLRPELAATLGPERFLREIDLAAQLRHPHILPLYDSGQAEGILYYVMPFVEGESLRVRLGREGQLPVAEALRLAAEVADALGYAHARGVVHRDIKPENILLESGHAVVTDFGIARAIGAAGGERLTSTGLALGTPLYMSPEQAAGEKQIDGRTDLYALGCVLYEMLAGTPPFAGATAQAVLARHTLDPVPSIRTVRGTVPEALERIVVRALAKAPVDRFATAEELAGALSTLNAAGSMPATAPPRRPASPRGRRIAGAAALALAGALVGGLWWLRAATSKAPSAGGGSVHRVAVLTFANLSPDTADAYLAQGIGQEIAARLGDAPGLSVAGRGSIGRLERAGAAGLTEQARALRLRYLVEGTVRREGSRVRVSVSLVDAAQGFQTWTRRYDRQATSILDLQDEIATGVAHAVATNLTNRSRARPTANPAAHDRLLRGNYYLAQRNPRGLVQAVRAYAEAARLDSTFALAHAKFALAHVLLLDWGWTYDGLPAESLLARGRVAADRARGLDSTLADAWFAHGAILTLENPTTLTGVRAAHERALTLDPENADALTEYGLALRFLGQPEAAEDQFKRAVAADPERPVSLLHLAWIAMEQRRWADATQWLDSATAVDPGFFQAYAERATVRLMTGDTARARADAETAIRLRPPVDGLTGERTLLELDRMAGRTQAVRARLERIRAYAPNPSAGVHQAAAWAGVLVAAGSRGEALEFLDRVPPRTRTAHLRIHLAEVAFDPIRKERQFQQLVDATKVTEIK